MRIVATGDWHYTESPPRMRRASYAAELLAKLDEVAEIARKHEADLILCPGDFFHRRDVGYHELTAIMRAIERFPCPLAGVFGNHDVPGGARSDIKRKAVGVLAESGYVTHLDGCPMVVGEGQGEGGRPAVLISGCDWRPSGDGHGKPAYVPPSTDADVVIHVSHGDLYRKAPGIPDFIASTPADLLEECERLPDVLLNGHIHGEVGVSWHGDGDRRFLLVTPGALMRGALTHQDIHRRPSIALIEAVPGREPRAKLVELVSAKPAEDVYLDPSEIVAASADKDEIAQFVDRLAEDWNASADMPQMLATVIDQWPADQEAGHRPGAQERARVILENARGSIGR